MPKPRKRLVSLDATPYYHCIARCVRRAFLCGQDPHSGFSFEHRRQWIVDRINLLASVFSVDVCAYAVMSNHYHVVLHIDAEQANHWSNREVAKRWLKLFSGPLIVRSWLAGAALTAGELAMVDQTLEAWRCRLHDLSWFMRCLNEPIARMANQEDRCTGRFWEGRFKSQALLDEQALLSCMAYVDLNPVRAAMAPTPEDSDYTSIQQRIRRADEHTLMAFTHDPATVSEDARPFLPFALPDYRELQKHIKPREDYQLLQSVPGIGSVLGTTIALETGTIERFASPGNYASYARCVKSEKISNNKYKGQGNKKNGNKYLAWAFMEAGHYAAIWDPRIKRFYQRKKAKAHILVAKKAVANKLARACYHMLKRGEKFDVTRAFS